MKSRPFSKRQTGVDDSIFKESSSAELHPHFFQRVGDSLFRSICVQFSLCIESTSNVFSFRIVFFYHVTTICMRIQSINQSSINRSWQLMVGTCRDMIHRCIFCYLNLPISKCKKSSPLSQGKNTPSVKGKAYTTSSTYKEETAMVQNTRKKLDVQRDLKKKKKVGRQLGVWLSGRLHISKNEERLNEGPRRQCVCVCFLPIPFGNQVRWTYQPGSHRRKAA